MACYRVYQQNRGVFHFTLNADDNTCLLGGGPFHTREVAVFAVSNCRVNSQFEQRFQRLSTDRRQFYFVLHAPSTGAIGTSPMFRTARERNSALAALVRAAPDAEFQDDTLTPNVVNLFPQVSGGHEQYMDSNQV